MPLLELRNIVKHFPVRRGFFGRAREFVHAVNGVTLAINEGETLGVVGESGCGKTTLGRVIVRLIKPTSGEVIFDGVDVTDLPKKALASFRRRVQIIFQDPFSSLNPRMPVGDIISEPLLLHGLCSKRQRLDAATSLLQVVGLDPAFVHRYPHEFSGGQRQRISIARAIATKPRLIVADEPVSSLDVSVQADILTLLKKLKQEEGIAFLFISHDLRIVASLCDRIAVMYLGKIVELLEAGRIRDALHPYTLALLSAVPVADPLRAGKPIILKGDIPSSVHIPKGCPFYMRCQYKEDVCEIKTPVLELKVSNHLTACHFVEKVRMRI